MDTVSWVSTSLILNGVFTIGMIVLFVAILLVLIVDVAKNACNHRRRSPTPVHVIPNFHFV